MFGQNFNIILTFVHGDDLLIIAWCGWSSKNLLNVRFNHRHSITTKFPKLKWHQLFVLQAHSWIIHLRWLLGCAWEFTALVLEDFTVVCEVLFGSCESLIHHFFVRLSNDIWELRGFGTLNFTTLLIDLSDYARHYFTTLSAASKHFNLFNLIWLSSIWLILPFVWTNGII